MTLLLSKFCAKIRHNVDKQLSYSLPIIWQPCLALIHAALLHTSYCSDEMSDILISQLQTYVKFPVVKSDGMPKAHNKSLCKYCIGDRQIADTYSVN